MYVIGQSLPAAMELIISELFSSCLKYFSGNYEGANLTPMVNIRVLFCKNCKKVWEVAKKFLGSCKKVCVMMCVIQLVLTDKSITIR